MSSDGFGVRLTQRKRNGDRNPSLRIFGKEGVASDRQEPRITSRVNPEQEYLEDRWTEIGGNDHPEQTPEAFTRDPMVPSLAFQREMLPDSPEKFCIYLLAVSSEKN